MAANYISEFYIKALFGEKDVRITFDSDYKILVSENGYGKTTILNLFHALLSGEISKLEQTDFSEIGVVFEDKHKIFFDKSEIFFDKKSKKQHVIARKIQDILGEKAFLELSLLTNRKEIYFRLKRLGLRDSEIDCYFDEIHARKNQMFYTEKLQEYFHRIKNQFSLQFLYLPTYRRIEENLLLTSSAYRKSPSRYSDENPYSNLPINFGMNDVENLINTIASEIINSSVAWFSKINGQMLSQLVDDFQVTDEMKAAILKPKAIEIVLARIGDNISEANKKKILNLVETQQILHNHDPLVYFVTNLLNVYEQQQENDSAIQAFTSVCNKYLRDKEIIYDESKVKIEIIRKKSKKSVDMEHLSSGEKQIISLFAMLYLQKDTDFAVFFDEPELSLSIEWQRMLLPDIIDSGKCKFLFCTTHSPFIFDNDLQQYTADLAMYIEE